MKTESRILIMKEFKDCLGRNLTLYAIVRGEKGIEHLGLTDGSSNTTMRYLHLSRLIDEVRLIINLNEPCEHKLQGLPYAVKLRVKESLKLLNALSKEVNRLICTDTT